MPLLRLTTPNVFAYLLSISTATAVTAVTAGLVFAHLGFEQVVKFGEHQRLQRSWVFLLLQFDDFLRAIRQASTLLGTCQMTVTSCCRMFVTVSYVSC